MRGILQRIGAIAGKELVQLRRDRLSVGMVFGIPLALILIFGYSIDFDVRHLRAGVVDDARTTASRALIQDLEATQVVKFSVSAADPAELRRLMDAGKISAGLYIPPDFERRRLEAGRPVAQLLVDGSDPGIEAPLRQLADLPVRAGVSMAPDRPRSLEVMIDYNPERRTAVQIVPALIGVILTLTMVIFTAIAIVRERERGNLELLITTPVSVPELLIGKLLPYVGVGLLQTTIVLGAGVLLFDVPVAGSLVDLYAGALFFVAATLSLGLVISTLAQTQFQAMQLGFFTMLPSILLSGFIFPFDGMPRPAQWFAQVLPLTHFNEIVRGVVLRGAPLWDLRWPLSKLGIFLLVAMTVAALRFRKRLG